MRLPTGITIDRETGEIIGVERAEAPEAELKRITRALIGRSGHGYTEEDGADRPEGKRVPGGDDPVLHGPAVEQIPMGRMEHAGQEPGQGRGSDHRRRPISV